MVFDCSFVLVVATVVTGLIWAADARFFRAQRLRRAAGGAIREPVVVEYEADPDLRDTEQVPLLEEGGIEAFLRREVLPHAADAWHVPESVRTGYEVSFTRYFYKPHPLRTLQEIRADILALEKETSGLLADIIG